jgi:hypothetical protein
MQSRSANFKDFKKFEQHKDNRSMDDICNSTGDFMLQAQQKFLVNYMQKNPSWRSMLLYHAIGSGKTCSGISMAEEYMRSNPEGKVVVILPARLKTNFFDELISPCGADRYISKEDFKTYHDPSTSKSKKTLIRKKFMDAIKKRYDIMSFEKMKTLSKSFSSLQEWAEHLTKDRMVIIDEIHNLLNDKVKYEIKEHNIPSRTKGVMTLLFKYLTLNAHSTCKMVLMTATPIFDNINQIRALLHALNPDYEGPTTRLSEIIEGLRGKVSYFPGTSVKAYPSTSFVTHEIPLSKTQDLLTSRVIDDENDDDLEAFMSKQRQISLSCFPKNDKSLSKVDEYAPKVVELLKQLNKPGKHLVYSSFVEKGLHVVRDVLVKAGWTDYFGSKKTPYKTFAIWDGKTSDIEKENIKSTANSKDNIDGKVIKLLLGSPSVKEGVSFKHIQHLHMMDPVWNQSSKSQIEGRAIRFCSHVDINLKTHSALKRSVVIHMYKSINIPKGLVPVTCDMKIYETIIPKKYKEVKKAEEALQRVALDYHLFKRLYKQSPHSRPPTPNKDVKSPILIEEDGNIGNKKRKDKAVKNFCPKARRPNKDTGRCELPDYEKRLNIHGNECCYKKKKVKTTVKSSRGKAV